MTLSATASRPVSLELDSPELAATYDATSSRQFDHGKLLIAALELQRGERVLDVGCGTGRLGAHVAELVAPQGEVVGIDPLPLRVALASGKHPRFRAAVGRAEDLSSIADASFDALYSNSVLHWVADKATALREAFRVLRSGGRIGVNSADADRPHQSIALVQRAVLGSGLESHRSGGQVNHRVNGETLRRLLSDAGFRDVQAVTHTFVDDIAGVDDLLAWSSSSSFGNFLAGLSAGERAGVRERLDDELERLRTPTGIRLERYLVFATAKKP